MFLIFGSLAPFMQLYIDCSHFTVHLFLLFEFLTAFILEKLSLSACRAVDADGYVSLIFWQNLEVALIRQSQLRVWAVTDLQNFEARR